MRKCLECGTVVEDGCEICPECGRVSGGRRGFGSGPYQAQSPKTDAETDASVDAWKARRDERTLLCVRCQLPLQFLETKRFEEHTLFEGIPLLDIPFWGSTSFDVYFCGTCGKVELFLAGIGREQRQG